MTILRPAAMPTVAGPRGTRLARRDHAAWAAGQWHRISDATSFPGHRIPPRVWRR
jgi:hypothetical protein